MAHRVILSTKDIRSYDDTQPRLNTPDYPLCNLGYANGDGDYIFRGIDIGDVTQDAVYGDVQTIKVTFAIRGDTKPKLAKNITTIREILVDSENFYDDALKRSSRRSDNAGHGADFSSFATGFIYGHAKKTGVLSVKADGLDETCCFDILSGVLDVPKNYLNVAWGNSVVVDAVLTLKVIAGGRGSRVCIDQRLPYGNFETHTGSDTKTFIYSFTNFTLADYGTVVNPDGSIMRGKFGTRFLQYANNTNFDKNNVVVLSSSAALIASAYPYYDGSNLEPSSEDVLCTPSYWLYLPTGKFSNGYITAYVEYYVGQNGVAGNYWQSSTTPFAVLAPNTQYPIATWFEVSGKAFNVPTGDMYNNANGLAYLGYRIRLEISITSKSSTGVVDPFFTWLGLDGFALNHSPALLYNEYYTRGGGEYVERGLTNSDPKFLLYGVRGDMAAKVRLRIGNLRNYAGGAGGANSYTDVIVSNMHYDGKYNEVPLLPDSLPINDTGYAVDGVNSFLTTWSPYQYYIYQTMYYAIQSSNDILRRTFKFTANTDRITRNYLLCVLYESTNNISQVDISLGGEKQTFVVSLPKTNNSGENPVYSTNFRLGILGEYQFPQPNLSHEDLVQIDYTNKPKDTVLFTFASGASYTANDFLGVSGLVAIPLDELGMLSLKTPLSYGVTILSSETAVPSASVVKQPLSPTNLQLPIPITSHDAGAIYQGGDIEILPNNFNEQFNESELFVLLLLTYASSNTYTYKFTGIQLFNMMIEYTPRFTNGVGNFTEGSALDTTTGSASFLSSLANFGLTTYVPSLLNTLTGTKVGSTAKIDFGYNTAPAVAPLVFYIYERGIGAAGSYNYTFVGSVPFVAGTNSYSFTTGVLSAANHTFIVVPINKNGSNGDTTSVSVDLSVVALDSITNKAMQQFNSGNNWAKKKGFNVTIGEIGWRNNDTLAAGDSTKYNAVATQWFNNAEAAIIPKNYGILGTTTSSQLTTSKTNGSTMCHITIDWSLAQSAYQGALDTTYMNQQTALISAAVTAGLKVILEIRTQYPPSFVTANVPRFKAQDGTLWSATSSSGDEVCDFVYTQIGRDYMSDFINKVLTYGGLDKTKVYGIKTGGLNLGELHYPPSTNSPFSSTNPAWWCFSTAAQTGTGLASGQTVSPYPAYSPFPTSGDDTTKDTAVVNWYIQSLVNFETWLISTIRTNYTGYIFMMHPGFGARTNWVFGDTNYKSSMSRGEYFEATVPAYNSDAKVYPYSTWIDQIFPWATPTVDSDEPAWLKLWKVASDNGKADLLMGENTGGQTNADMDRVFNQAMRFYTGLFWLDYTQLNAGGSNATLANWSTNTKYVNAVTKENNQYKQLLVTPWSSGQYWGSYPLTIYGKTTSNIDTAYPPATVIEPYLTHAGLLVGMNLSGAEFGGTSLFATAADFNYLNTKGYKFIRIPIEWSRVQPTLNGTLASSEVTGITNMLGYAAANGQKCILDIHDYARYNSIVMQYNTGTVNESHLKDFINKLLTACSAYANTSLYALDIMNEPHDLAAVAGASVFTPSVTRYTFESTSQGWSGEGSTVVARDTTQFSSGVASLKVTGSGLSTTGTYSQVRANDSATNNGGAISGATSLKARIKLSASAVGTWSAKIEYQNTSFQWISPDSGNVNLVAGSWVDVVCTYNAGIPSTARAFDVQIQNNACTQATVDFWIDDYQEGTLASSGGLTASQVWENITASVVTYIRNTLANSTIFLVIPTYQWSGIQVAATNHPNRFFNDYTGKFWVEMHQYFDSDNSGTYSNTYAYDNTAASGQGY